MTKFYYMTIPFNYKLKLFCKEKHNRLSIGLDLDPDKLPENIGKNILNIRDFLKDIIDSTISFCPVYKPNLAFYERFGSKGYGLLEFLVEYINGRAITIADGKRGDIGNTSKQYAYSIFYNIGFDSITVSPYMGSDSIIPFIEDEEKGAFVLCLTSNKSALDFQYASIDNDKLYENVAKLSVHLNQNKNVGLVVGATNEKQMNDLRVISPQLPWLIPGIGAQGGNLEASILIGNRNATGIINVSRGILYAGDGSLDSIVESAQSYTTKIRRYL